MPDEYSGRENLPNLPKQPENGDYLILRSIHLPAKLDAMLRQTAIKQGITKNELIVKLLEKELDPQSEDEK